MCQPLPGPRCASHTRARKNQLSRKAEELAKRISTIDSAQQEAANNGEPFPAKKLKERDQLVERRKRTIRELSLAVRDYDGTKTGRQELERKIARAKTIKERKRLEARMREGAMLVAWRKNALDKVRNDPGYNFNSVALRDIA